MIAGAITLKDFPVFWRDVDGTTHGPLVQAPLALSARAGMRLDYTNARIFSALLMWSTLVCAWLTLRRMFGCGLARILILPAAFTVAGTLFWDFVQYSSEHVPVAMLACATWLLARDLFPEVRIDRPWSWFISGMVLGAIPFAKLQAVPIGLWLGGCALIILAIDRSHGWSARGRAAAALIAGALVVPALVTAAVLGWGIWPDYWTSYFVTNSAYASDTLANVLRPLRWVYDSARHADLFLGFFIPGLALILAGSLISVCWRAWRPSERRFLAFAVGMVPVAYYAVAAPGRHFQHYFQFLIIPVALGAAAAMGLVISAIARSASHRPAARHWIVALALACYVLFGLGFQIDARLSTQPEYLGRYTQTRGKLSRRPVSDLVRKFAQPGDRLAVWGWMPLFFVETGLPQATREAHTFWQITPTPLRDAYRQRYWADFQRSNPTFFLDVVGPDNFSFTNRIESGHESFATLAQHIAANYRLVADHVSTRVYIRNDRAAELKPDLLATLNL